jgi:hypothetical protein
MVMTAVLLGDTKYVIRNTFLKLLAVFLLTTCCLLLTTNPAFAQTPASPSAISSQQSTTNPSANLPSSYLANSSFSPQSPHTASLAIYNFSHAVSCLLIGQSPISPCLEYKFYKDVTGMVKSVPILSSTSTSNGVLGLTFSMVEEVVDTKPISSSIFLANLGDQMGIRSAHAQVGGSGSGVLSPIFKLWEVSRNIAYLVMILIFVLVGLMVMFRQRLNPQTVVSVQMALPGLVIGLVMITFSYFLASLISDIAFIGTNVVGYYFSLAQGGTEVTQLPLITNPNPGSYNPRPNTEDNAISIFSRYVNIINTSSIHEPLAYIWPYLKGRQVADPSLLATIGNTGGLAASGPGFASVADFILNFDAQKALQTLVTMFAVQFVLPFGGLFGGPGQAVSAGGAAIITGIAPVWLVSWSLAFVAMLVLVYSMFRLLLKLISNFLSIIFLTISAPFFFLIASIPGRQSIATTWMFNMLCNVLAFPAVFAVFYFVAFILGNNQDPLFKINEGSSLAGSAVFPLLGGINLKFLNLLVAFGALVASPSIPDIICKAVGKPSQLGGLAAGAISGAISQGQRYQGQISGGTSGFAGNVGRLTDTEHWDVESVDQLTGKKTYKLDAYKSPAGRFAQIGRWADRTFNRPIPHEQQVHDPNRHPS